MSNTFQDIFSPSQQKAEGGRTEGQRLFLAPMEDVTDIGFRRLCKRFGAAMVYTEFVAAEALVRSVKHTVQKLAISDDERPVGIQIYGRGTADVVEAARIVEAEAHPDVIDLNFGCPVKKVAGKGAGAGMLQKIPLLLEMTEAVVKAVNTPVTVKTRLGWNTDNFVFSPPTPQGGVFNSGEVDEGDEGLSKEYTPTGGWQGRDLADHLYDCGISALTIHGRTRAQMYTGNADWTLIGGVAQRLHERAARDGRFFPVIGNGDITSLDEADQAFRAYGVDAVMIGRATFGQPWIFSREATASLTTADKIDLLIELLNINLNYIGDEYRAVLHTRRHLAATPVFKGIPDFRPTRIKMLRAEKVDELTQILNELKTQLQ